jgi:hypothetical protein
MEYQLFQNRRDFKQYAKQTIKQAFNHKEGTLPHVAYGYCSAESINLEELDRNNNVVPMDIEYAIPNFPRLVGFDTVVNLRIYDKLQSALVNLYLKHNAEIELGNNYSGFLHSMDYAEAVETLITATTNILIEHDETYISPCEPIWFVANGVQVSLSPTQVAAINKRVQEKVTAFWDKFLTELGDIEEKHERS